MSIEERRNKFREWASVTVQNNTTIDGYIESLDRDIPQHLDIDSIFSIENINEINTLHSRCGVNGDLYEFSRNIGNGRPQASLGKYKKYLQYSLIMESMEKYDNSPNDFELNGAHWNFTVSGNDRKYPVKAICRNVAVDLGLDDQFTTNQAKSILRSVFPQNTIDFIDTNDNQGFIENPMPNPRPNNVVNKIKNIILYGSPGVGKTYNTNKLIKLIEDRKSDRDIFEEIKSNKESGSVNIDDIADRVKFLTFHQSFGYEDFIEGFRPNEEGKIELSDGVFKKLCDLARQSYINIDDFLDEMNEKPDQLWFETKEGIVNATLNSNRGYTLSNHHTLTRQNVLKCLKLFHEIWELDQREPEIEEILETGITESYRYSYWLFAEKLYTNYKASLKSKQNYYLVIDEINRGNISKIFGELITLIEEDKRDTLEVTLPYSKELFKIPSNLYIIGTMNSTDKSIALIDIALRRRFTFLKMKPNADLITNSRAREVFIVLNAYITEKLGEDYQIGHSYFMGDIDLEFVLEYKIIPLLEEYFYGDLDGLNKVLEILDGM